MEITYDELKRELIHLPLSDTQIERVIKVILKIMKIEKEKDNGTHA